MNLEILKDNDFDIGRVISSSPFSPLSIGSEFKPAHVLEPLLEPLSYWPSLKRSLITGAHCPLRDLDDDLRQKDFEMALSKGNGRAANEESEWIAEQFDEEIRKGWVLALPLEAHKDLKGCVFAPLNVVKQDTINEFNEIVDKKRLCHNLSSEGKFSKESVNSRTIREELSEVFYGHALLRLIHYIVWLRICYPTERILLTKGDFKSAYRRLHASFQAILLSVSTMTWKGFKYLPGSP